MYDKIDKTTILVYKKKETKVKQFNFQKKTVNVFVEVLLNWISFFSLIYEAFFNTRRTGFNMKAS